jgi:broad specificity phosphatase PhoE
VRLLILRHGRTEANASGLLLGRLDVELDAVGRAQAERLSAAIGPVDRVITSPLQRARQTAAAITGPLTVDDRLIELDYGELDGVAFGDVPTEMWDRWRRDLDFAPPGGESLAHLGARVRAFLDELSDPGSDGSGGSDEVVAVVSHVSPIKAAVAWALGATDELTGRLYVAPASISEVEVTGRSAVLRRFNETMHTTGL